MIDRHVRIGVAMADLQREASRLPVEINDEHFVYRNQELVTAAVRYCREVDNAKRAERRQRKRS